ncbi:MAG: YceI family protein [Pseudomonadota bacterium]
MKPLLLATCLTLAAGGASAWTLDSDVSSVSFVSMKNAEVAEAHSFGSVAGSVDDSGKAVVEITLASVNTGIDIRDERMRDHLFDVASTPLAVVTADVGLDALEDLAVGARKTVELPLTVAAHGSEISYDADVHVTRISEDRVAVSSITPVIVEAFDFAYEDGVEQLREIAGLDSIQFAVPVGFDLVFQR